MTDRRLRVIQRGSNADADESEVLALLDQTVRIILPRSVPGWRHQLLAIALVDLLGRLFPRLDLVLDDGVPADPLLPPGPRTLVERLEEARCHGIGPQELEGDPSVTIMVGPSEDPADVYVDGDGWQSYVGSRPSRLEARGDRIAIGPLVAACRAANQAFQLALGEHLAQPTQRIESAYSSALTYASGTDPLVEPEMPTPAEIAAVLVGVGSIGGATIYALARTPRLRGELCIVDDDALRDHNPDRAILATEALARVGAVKVEVARDALGHHEDLDVRPHRKRFEAFVAERPRDLALPLVLSAVDSTASRREIQDAVPLDVLDAACGVDQVSLSAHRTADGPCIYCLHVGTVLDSARIKHRLIAERTGLLPQAVAELHVRDTRLSAQHIRAIEQFRREHGDPLVEGALDGYIDETLETLYSERFLYGEALIGTAGGGQAAVAAPFVTALAGFLLAGEAIKTAADPAFEPCRLGAGGQIGTMYREDPWSSPLNRLLTNPPRRDGLECLCRSPLRLRLLHERYAL